MEIMLDLEILKLLYLKLTDPFYYKIVELELATTLTNAINATDTTITLDDMPTVTTLGDTWPSSGFMIIEKVNSETGMFEIRSN